MKKIVKSITKQYAIVMATALCSTATLSAATIIFDPTQPLVVTEASFTGTTSIDGTYTRVRVVFTFTNKDADPFTITNISATGDGINGSLSFNNLTISGDGPDEDGQFFTNYVNLSSPIAELFFANNSVSFTIPEDSLNTGSSFTSGVRYANANGSQINTSSGGDLYTAAIPEPSISLMGAVWMCLVLRRRRSHAA